MRAAFLLVRHRRAAMHRDTKKQAESHAGPIAIDAVGRPMRAAAGQQFADGQGDGPVTHQGEHHGHPGVLVAAQGARQGGVGVIEDLVDGDEHQQVGGDGHHFRVRVNKPASKWRNAMSSRLATSP